MTQWLRSQFVLSGVPKGQLAACAAAVRLELTLRDWNHRPAVSLPASLQVLTVEFELEVDEFEPCDVAISLQRRELADCLRRTRWNDRGARIEVEDTWILNESSRPFGIENAG